MHSSPCIKSGLIPLLALRVDLTGPVFRRLTKDKRTTSEHGKTDVMTHSQGDLGYSHLGWFLFRLRMSTCQVRRSGRD